MKIYTKDLKLLDSARICCPNNESVILEHEFDANTVMKMEFKFNYNDKGFSVDMEDKEGHPVFVLNNFDNPFGSGLKAPVEIGKYNKKKIYIVFVVFKLKEFNPILDVSLYLEV